MENKVNNISKTETSQYESIKTDIDYNLLESEECDRNPLPKIKKLVRVFINNTRNPPERISQNRENTMPDFSSSSRVNISRLKTREFIFCQEEDRSNLSEDQSLEVRLRARADQKVETPYSGLVLYHLHLCGSDSLDDVSQGEYNGGY